MTDDLVKQLRRDLASGLSASIGDTQEAADRIEELDTIFDLRWECDRRAIKQWQEAHPGNARTWPDGADLCVWLMEKVEELEERLAASNRKIEDLEDEVINLEYEMIEREIGNDR